MVCGALAVADESCGVVRLHCSASRPRRRACPPALLALQPIHSHRCSSLLQRFGPLMNEGGAAISLTYVAADRVIPGGWLLSV